MLDEILVDIISLTIGAVGLIGAITRYDYPKARRTVYGENLYSLKENIINNKVTWNFTYYAAVGLLFQIIYNSILSNETPDRIYSKGFYFAALAISIILVASLIPIIKTISRWSARKEWRAIILKKANKNFQLAKELYKQDENKGENKKATEIIAWLEDLLEIKSQKTDLKSRIEYFEPYFK